MLKSVSYITKPQDIVKCSVFIQEKKASEILHKYLEIR